MEIKFKDVMKYSAELNVLYVEDNKNLREETAEILNNFFANVDLAVDGQDGLDMYNQHIEANSQFYDIVITDLNMPVMGGYDMIVKIHEINMDQSVVVISANNDFELLLKLIDEGITNFLTKPINLKQLIKTFYHLTKDIDAFKKKDYYFNKLEELNNSLEEKVEQQSEEIRTIQYISMEAIANLVESYDEETGNHVKRIESYTALMINHLVEDEKCDKIKKDLVPFASVLHDIGKLTTPRDILKKPARLEDDEMLIMQQHAEVGGKLLADANKDFKAKFHKDSYLSIASKIANYHHEKYDGTGYPEGLKGKEIPRCARIVAVADVYDALRSTRVYKKGWSHEETVQYIKDNRGTSFDPDVVDAFVKTEDYFNVTFETI